MVRGKFHLVLILFGLKSEKSERTSWKFDGDFVVMIWPFFFFFFSVV